MQSPSIEPTATAPATTSADASSTAQEARPERAIVAANTLEVEGVRRLTVTPTEPWSFRTGQVAELSVGSGTEGYFAIASAPREVAPLVFLIKAGGSDSEPLMRLEPGAELTLRGPYGPGFSLPASSAAEDLLFVSAGTAIAAVRSAVTEVLGTGVPHRVSVVVGVRRLADLCFAEELAGWARRGVDVCVCVSGALANDEDVAADLAVARGRVQGQLGPRVRSTTRAFIAGSEALEDEVSAALLRLGVALDRIQRNYRPDHRELA